MLVFQTLWGAGEGPVFKNRTEQNTMIRLQVSVLTSKRGVFELSRKELSQDHKTSAGGGSGSRRPFCSDNENIRVTAYTSARSTRHGHGRAWVGGRVRTQEQNRTAQYGFTTCNGLRVERRLHGAAPHVDRVVVGLRLKGQADGRTGHPLGACVWTVRVAGMAVARLWAVVGERLDRIVATVLHAEIDAEYIHRVRCRWVGEVTQRGTTVQAQVCEEVAAGEVPIAWPRLPNALQVRH